MLPCHHESPTMLFVGLLGAYVVIAKQAYVDDI